LEKKNSEEVILSLVVHIVSSVEHIVEVERNSANRIVGVHIVKVERNFANRIVGVHIVKVERNFANRIVGVHILVIHN